MAYEYLNPGATSMADANWSAATGTSGAAYTLVVPDGGQTISAGLDHSGAAVGLSFEIARPFTGVIGSEGTPLELKLTDTTNAQKTSANTEGFFRYSASAGACFLEGGATVDTNAIDNVFIDSGGVLTLVAGNFPYVHLTAGRLNVLAAAIVQNLEVYGGTAVIDAAGSTNMSTLVQWGGSVTLKRPVSVGSGAITLHGGTLTYAYEGTTDTTTFNANNGTLIHRAGDITTFNHNAGLHDFSTLARASVITTRVRKPGARSLGLAVGGLLTITNDRTIGFPTFPN